MWQASLKATKADRNTARDKAGTQMFFLAMIQNYQDKYSKIVDDLGSTYYSTRKKCETLSGEKQINALRNSLADKRLKTLKTMVRDLKAAKTKDKRNKKVHEEILRQEFATKQKEYQEQFKAYDEQLQIKKKAKNEIISDLRKELKELEQNKGFIEKKLNLYKKK